VIDLCMLQMLQCSTVRHQKAVGVKASTGLDSTTCTKSELVASTLKE